MVSQINKWIAGEYGSLVAEKDGVLVLGLDKVSVQEAQELRNAVRETGAALHVTKNRLARVALEEAGVPIETDAWGGTCALLVGTTEETISAAKAIDELWKKGRESEITFRGAFFHGTTMGAAEAASIAKMPDRQTLRGMLAGAIAGTGRRLATILNEVPASTARCINARADQEEAA